MRSTARPPYLSGQVLLHVVAGDEDAPLEAPAFQIQVLALATQQVGLLLRLEVLDVLLLLGQPLLLLLLGRRLVLIKLLMGRQKKHLRVRECVCVCVVLK